MGQRPRLRLAGFLVAASALAASMGAAVGPASAAVGAAGTSARSTQLGTASVPVIVQARTGHRQEAAVAVRSAGGHVGRSLPIVEGFAAQLPTAAVRQLSADPAIRTITPDSHVRFSMRPVGADDFADSADSRDVASNSTAGDFGGTADDGLATNYPRSTGATSAWAQGTRGAGVSVAVIDTGISPVPDLAGRTVAGPDFSGERNSLRDSYGHGTVMAGVVAGNGTSSASAPGGAYIGMAPEARVVSVKVAGRNGATDVSKVLAAMQWVGSYHTQHNIRVVNLSWGTTSHQSPSRDPLNFAVQRLWGLGIVVVAAAGNDGPASGTITKPGDDPVIITAGAYDDRQNTSLTDDVVTAWSSRGPTAAGTAKPDVIAPGRTIVSTRAAGSYVEANNPQAHVGSHYIRGSGTSQASAVVAGSVALLLGRRPSWRPDQVKHALTSSAIPINGSGVDGHGRASVPGMLRANVRSAPVQSLTSNGLGSLEASRGGRHVDTVCAGDTAPTRIEGEIDGLCLPWDADTWSGENWSSESWSSDIWSSDSWTSDSWTSDTWTSDTWSGTEFLTAFWGLQTPWWQHLPGETAAAHTSDAPAVPRANK